MMMIKHFLWHLLFFGFINIEHALENPCKTSKELKHMNIRYAVFKTDIHSHNYIDDFYTEEGWYNVGRKHMIQSYPGHYRCSTYFPIFMNGSTDISDGEEVTRKICAYDYTEGCRPDTKTIRIKNCTDYNVYLLHPTDEYEAYCFEDNDTPPIDHSEIEPTEKISEIPVVLCGMQTKKLDAGTVPKYSCKCEFQALSDDSLLYQVNWYKNEVLEYVSKQTPYEDINETNFNEDRFQRLGLTISCAVRISKKTFGSLGPSSPISAGVFIGIKVEKDRFRVTRGSTVSISLTVTMPLHCMFANPFCAIKLRVLIPEKNDKCGSQLSVMRNKDCELSIDNDNWNETHVFNITVRKSMHYRDKEYNIFFVYLQTHRNQLVTKIWDKYKLPPIKIEVVNGTIKNKWEGKSCYARNDPRMKSFDGLYYENQNPGTYLMYRNSKTVFGVMEVMIKTTKCNRWFGDAYCVCGVAVRAGKDVYKIDRCNLNDLVIMKYMTCHSDYLDLRKVNEKEYKVYLPIGTYITIRQSFGFLDVDINPSLDDEGNTEGLCGILNGNMDDDLTLRGGDSFPESIKNYLERDIFERHPQAFTDSWNVSDQDNLFNKTSQEDVIDYLSKTPYKGKITLCECTADITESKHRTKCKGDLIAEHCKTSWYRDHIDCSLNVSISRKRRFAHRPSNIVPNYRQKIHHERIKRELSAIKQVNMTKEEARLHCERKLYASPSFRACTAVPNVNATVSVGHCVADIMLSRTLFWEYAAREGLKAGCIKELQQNRTLREKQADGSQSVAEKIFEIACPNECSGNGICKKGKCHCTGTYGAADCSLDLRDPPIVNGINIDEGGLCDINECNVAFVYGDDFVDSGSLTCMITHFEIDLNNTITNVGQYVIIAKHQTITEIHCSLVSLTSKEDAVTITGGNPFVCKVMIAISNNGNNFGDNHTLFMLDSKCQDTYDKNGTLMFALKGGWCFIKGHCVIHGGINRNDASKMCDASKDRFSWSNMPTTQASGTLPSPLESTTLHVTKIPVTDIGQRNEENSMLIIGMSVIGIILLAVVIIMIVILRKRQWRDYIVNKGKPTNSSDSGRNKMAPVSTTSLNFHDLIGYEVKICGNQTHGEKSNRMCDVQSLFNISEGQQRTENAENTDKTPGKNGCGDYVQRPFDNSSQSD